jgi:predicted nucleic acid-binding protein
VRIVVDTFICTPAHLSQQICTDPDDDKFIACALGSDTGTIVSRDKALLKLTAFQGIETITPRVFIDSYMG